MRAVNLLPPSSRRAPGFRGAAAPLVAAGAVVVLGAMGWWGYSTHQEASSLKEDVAAAIAERDGLTQQLGAFQQADAREDAQRLRRGAVVSLATGRINWERLIRELATVMPRQTWLTSLRAETPEAPADATAAAATPGTPDSSTPQGISLDGFARTQSQVAQLLARAGTVPGLGEPRLATSEVQRRGGRAVVHFVIDIPIDQRAQDRPTLTPVSTTPPATGATP